MSVRHLVERFNATHSSVNTAPPPEKKKRRGIPKVSDKAIRVIIPCMQGELFYLASCTRIDAIAFLVKKHRAEVLNLDFRLQISKVI